jgi:hypothetical protein
MTGSDGQHNSSMSTPSASTSPTTVALKEDVVLRMEKPASERTRQCVRISFAILNGVALILVITAVILASQNLSSVRSNYNELTSVRTATTNSKQLLENLLNAETGNYHIIIHLIIIYLILFQYPPWYAVYNPYLTINTATTSLLLSFAQHNHQN